MKCARTGCERKTYTDQDTYCLSCINERFHYVIGKQEIARAAAQKEWDRLHTRREAELDFEMKDQGEL